MLDVLIPVALSALLGPGAGQLYNREYRKGTYLIILSFVVLMAAGAWLRQAALPYLPMDLEAVTDRAALQQIIQNAVTHITSEHAGTFYVYEVLLLGTWMYSIIDAYRGGQRRRLLKTLPPSSPSNP